jgi:hypothetical protein
MDDTGHPKREDCVYVIHYGNKQLCSSHSYWFLDFVHRLEF